MTSLVRSLKRAGLLSAFSLFGALFIGASVAFAGGGTTDSYPSYISVNGTGTVMVDPDMATISFTVQTTDTTAKLAQDANAIIVHDIKNALTDAGESTASLKTTYFSTYPEYDYTYEDGSYVGEQYIKDYVTYHTFDLKVYNLNDVGDLADLVVANGANMINNISYSVEDTDQAEYQARKKAFAQAKARAKQLAQLGDVTIGSVSGISEYTYQSFYDSYYGSYSVSYDTMNTEVAAATVPEPGQIEVRVEISVTYDIQIQE